MGKNWENAKCSGCGRLIWQLDGYIICQCGASYLDGSSNLNSSDVKSINNRGLSELSSQNPQTKESLDELDRLVESFNSLPPHALYEPVTNADLLSCLKLIRNIFSTI